MMVNSINHKMQDTYIERKKQNLGKKEKKKKLEKMSLNTPKAFSVVNRKNRKRQFSDTNNSIKMFIIGLSLFSMQMRGMRCITARKRMHVPNT